MEQSDIQKYCDLMGEIKRRMEVIKAFQAGAANALYRATNIESVYLQFRKIVELIAFGSLVANKDAFSKVYADFARCWNAQYLVKDIERENPDFYPKPVAVKPSKIVGAKAHLEPKKSGFLSKDDLLKLYEKCGALMHANNPYGSQVDLDYHEKQIPVWKNKIISLLTTHTIKLLNDPNLYLVQMERKGDNRVVYNTFAPKPKGLSAQ